MSEIGRAQVAVSEEAWARGAYVREAVKDEAAKALDKMGQERGLKRVGAVRSTGRKVEAARILDEGLPPGVQMREYEADFE